MRAVGGDHLVLGILRHSNKGPISRSLLLPLEKVGRLVVLELGRIRGLVEGGNLWASVSVEELEGQGDLFDEERWEQRAI